MKRGFRLVSMLLVAVLLMSVFVTPVAAGRENDRGQRNVSPPEVQYLDAEVKVIDGQPVLRYETEEGYANIPFALSEVISSDGQTIPLQRQGSGVVVPTEDGPVVVPLEDFDVAMVSGQLALVAEVNPLPVIVAGAVLGGLTGLGAGAIGVAALKSVGFAVSPAVAKGIVAGGGIAGAIRGATR